jgi:hypothetical protein
MKKLLAAAASLLVGAAQAQVLSDLHARDINGDGSIDAFYDSLLDVTWLADANHYLTAGFPPEYDYIASANGRTVLVGEPGSYFPAGSMMQWTAQQWAYDLNYLGIDDWRLPQRFFPELEECYINGGAICNTQDDRRPSELTVMATRLAGTSGPFVNVQGSLPYFTLDNSIVPPYLQPTNWFGLVNVITGSNGSYDAGEAYGFAWAVRDGDVAAVPEPSTYALMLAGLVLVGAASRRRRAGSESAGTTC